MRNDQNQLARLQRIICFVKALYPCQQLAEMYIVWHIYTGHCTAHA